jgi:hypothetical protein
VLLCRIWSIWCLANECGAAIHSAAVTESHTQIFVSVSLLCLRVADARRTFEQHIGAYRRMSAHIFTNRRISALPPTVCYDAACAVNMRACADLSSAGANTTAAWLGSPELAGVHSASHD